MSNITVKDIPNIELYYYQVTDLWKRLCEEHNALLDATFEEYSQLLESNIELLEKTIEMKVDIIEKINTLDEIRGQVLVTINEELQRSNTSFQISNVTELIIFMQNYEMERKEKHLYRFNELLIDIITKIQEQNRRNQQFLHKAIYSVEGLKQELAGKKSYSVYNAKGEKALKSL
jgi:flagellar biosynthesis/type III secretory pathway chaperone